MKNCKAVDLVCSFTFEPVGDDSTRMKLSVHAMGEFGNDLPRIVDNVWKHFLFEQLKPYLESGKHLQK